MKFSFSNSHLFNVLVALFVTILWSSSFVIIKQWLASIPALTFAAYRYLIASTVLLSFILIRKDERKQFSNLDAKTTLKLFGYGLIFITITQGAGFLSLDYLTAITVSFSLNFSTIVIVILSYFLLKEIPNNIQNLLIIISLLGVGIYFLPLDLSGMKMIGLVFLFLAVFANSLSTVIGRSINHQGSLTPLFVTAISMGFGGVVLTGVAFVVMGFRNLEVMR